MYDKPPFFGRLFRFFAFIFFGMATFVGSIIILFMLFGGFIGMMISDKGAPSEIADDGFRYIEGKKNSKNIILSIPVQGVILGSRESGNPLGMMDFGVTFGYDVQEQLKEVATKPEVKGILMEFTTPGGTIFGSQAIFDGIKYYQQKSGGKPVFVHIEGMSASGGVWSMVGADAIYADFGSMIGSIGILGPTLQYFDKPVEINGGMFVGGVVTENGIEARIISAGRSKDMGNPFRRPTDEEVAVLQDGVNSEYENFVNHVATNRKIEPDFIKTKLGALIFDNSTALKYKLIDGTKNRGDTITELVKKAGVDVADYKLVKKGSAKADFISLLTSRFNLNMNSGAELSGIVKAQKCSLTRQVAIAYFGNPAELCR